LNIVADLGESQDHQRDQERDKASFHTDILLRTRRASTQR
jgi:hypothetical protein